MCYKLRDDVLFCIAGGRVVILDLLANRYQSLPPAADAAFQQAASLGSLGEVLAPSLKPLENLGLVVHSAPPAPPLVPTTGFEPKSSLVNGNLHSVGIQMLFEATFVQLSASKFGRQTLRQIQASLSAKREQHFQENAVPAYLVSPVIAAQHYVPTEQKCLSKSLALLKFLEKRNYLPNLVVGVRMRPFAAHAWVQDRETVLNETLDEVLRYTPILVA